MAAATQANPTTQYLPIEVDPSNQEADDDSAYESETASYTTSIASSVVDYKTENGRRYHAFREGTYVFPNDEQEQERLDLVHRMWVMTAGEKLFLAPVKDPQRILDIGTGTGIWAIEVAEEFPKAVVIGNDLSAIQPKWVPPNLTFEIDDVESEWSYSTAFDFIHSRHMEFSIGDWPKLVTNCFKHTKPGGWVELQEGDYNLYSDDGTYKKGSAVDEWIENLFSCSRQMGKEPCPGLITERLMRDAGFLNVKRTIIKVPIGPWPKDRRLKEIGAFNLAGLLEGLEGFSMALFTRVLGKSPEWVQVFLTSVRKELQNPRIHTMYDWHIVYGQKPEAAKEA